MSDSVPGGGPLGPEPEDYRGPSADAEPTPVEGVSAGALQDARRSHGGQIGGLPAPEVGVPTYMGRSIAALVLGLFCATLLGGIAGIVAVVNSSRVSSRWIAGDHAGAERASARAKLWGTIAFVLAAIGFVIWAVAAYRLSYNRGG